MLVVLLAGAVLPLCAFAQQPTEARCGLYEEFRQCGPNCPYACDTLKKQVCCEARCAAGCFCADGYILLDSKASRRECVSLNACPKAGVLVFENPTIEVFESVGLVRIAVNRINGTRGIVTVKWRVKIIRGVWPSYDGRGGELYFEEGVATQTIDFAVENNQVRNDDIVLQIELYDPTNEGEIGEGNFVITVKDDDFHPGTLEFEEPVYEVLEGREVVRVGVSRLGGSDGEIRSRYRTLPGTATEDEDFKPARGTLVFPEGVTKAFLEIEIINDAVKEKDETFTVELYEPDAAPGVLNFRGLGPITSITVTIKDDDMTPGYLIIASEVITVEEGAGTIEVQIQRVGGSDGTIRAKFKTEARTAKSPEDFISVSGQVTFSDGETSKTISVKIVNDGLREETETFRFILYDQEAGYGVLNFEKDKAIRISIRIDILDDDKTPGVLEFEKSSYSVIEGQSSVTIAVVRTEGKDGVVSVQWRTADGTAKRGRDYLGPESGIISFNDGEDRRTFRIPIVNDELVEGEEQFSVGLFKPTNNAVLGPRSLATVNILDNKDSTSPSIPEPAGVFIVERTVRVNRKDKIARLHVRRTGDDSSTLTVSIRTFEGTAKPKRDYRPIRGTLTFQKNTLELTIQMKILQSEQTSKEPLNFIVRIANPSEGIIVPGKSSATVIIEDDQPYIEARGGGFLPEEPDDQSFSTPEESTENKEFIETFRCQHAICQGGDGYGSQEQDQTSSATVNVNVHQDTLEVSTNTQSISPRMLGGLSDTEGGLLQAGGTSGGILQSGDTVGSVLKSGETTGGILQSKDTVGGVLKSGDIIGGLLQTGDTVGTILKSADTTGGLLQSGDTIGSVLNSGDTTGGLLQSGDIVGTVLKSGGTTGGLLQSGDTVGGILNSGDTTGGLLQAGDTLGAVLNSGQTTGGILQSGDTIGGLFKTGDATETILKPSDNVSPRRQTVGGFFESGDAVGGVLKSGQTTGGLLESGDTVSGVLKSGQTAGGIFESGETVGGILKSGQTSGGLVESGDTIGGVLKSGKTAGAVLESGDTVGGVLKSGQTAGGIFESDDTVGGILKSGQTTGGIIESGDTIGGAVKSGQTAGGLFESGGTVGGVLKSGQTVGSILESGDTIGGTLKSGQTTGGLFESGDTVGSILKSGQTAGGVFESGNTVGGVLKSGQTTGGLFESGNTVGSVLKSGQTSGGLFESNGTVGSILKSGQTSGGLFETPDGTVGAVLKSGNTAGGLFESHGTIGGIFQSGSASKSILESNDREHSLSDSKDLLQSRRSAGGFTASEKESNAAGALLTPTGTAAGLITSEKTAESLGGLITDSGTIAGLINSERQSEATAGAITSSGTAAGLTSSEKISEAASGIMTPTGTLAGLISSEKTSNAAGAILTPSGTTGALITSEKTSQITGGILTGDSSQHESLDEKPIDFRSKGSGLFSSGKVTDVASETLTPSGTSSNLVSSELVSDTVEGSFDSASGTTGKITSHRTSDVAGTLKTASGSTGGLSSSDIFSGVAEGSVLPDGGVEGTLSSEKASQAVADIITSGGSEKRVAASQHIKDHAIGALTSDGIIAGKLTSDRESNAVSGIFTHGGSKAGLATSEKQHESIEGVITPEGDASGEHSSEKISHAAGGIETAQGSTGKIVSSSHLTEAAGGDMTSSGDGTGVASSESFHQSSGAIVTPQGTKKEIATSEHRWKVIGGDIGSGNLPPNIKGALKGEIEDIPEDEGRFEGAVHDVVSRSYGGGYQEQTKYTLQYVKKDAGNSGCPPGLEYRTCEKECPRTCANLDEPDSRCANARCISGCFCPHGRVIERLDSTPKCVTPDECIGFRSLGKIKAIAAAAAASSGMLGSIIPGR